MEPHKLTPLISICLFLTIGPHIEAQKQKVPSGGTKAVVVDERLSALRRTPNLQAALVRRLGRGRIVAVKTVRTARDGTVFFQVDVTRRTRGWIQREAVVVPSRKGDDERLLLLIRNSSDFDRIARARILLDHFPRSLLRAEVLMIMGDTAERLAARLTQEARRRLREHSSAPEHSYYLNYAGLDRYNRQGVGFTFNQGIRSYHYDGAAWREIVRRYPRSPLAEEARMRLAQLADATR